LLQCWVLVVAISSVLRNREIVADELTLTGHCEGSWNTADLIVGTGFTFDSVEVMLKDCQ
jgi:hypothetical protein